MSHKLKEKTHILVIGALGVVFGDIGTSPLYALKVCFTGQHALTPSPQNILGLVSLIFWSLTLVVSIKYALFIMRADDEGEGGVFAMLALLHKNLGPNLGRGLVLGGLFGSALLYGDGLITPVISVLSALEGLEVATTQAKPFVLPLTCLVLLLLFGVQSHGTGSIGKLFGPVMILWFIILAGLGLRAIESNPEILGRSRPQVCHTIFPSKWVDWFFSFGGRGALHHRMRGPVCRYGALRGKIYPHLLVFYRPAGAPLQLLRPRRLDFARSQDCHRLILPSCSTQAALSHGRPFYRGDHHRLSGYYFRSLFADQTGHAIGFPPGDAGAAYFKNGRRPGVCPRCEPDNAFSRHSAHPLLQDLRQSCRCLWHRGYGNHVYYLGSVLFIARRIWGWSLVKALPLCLLFWSFRSDLLQRLSGKLSSRGLVSLRHRFGYHVRYGLLVGRLEGTGLKGNDHDHP